MPGAGDGRGVVPRHRSRGLLRPVSDAAHMLLRPACVSSVVQLARVLTRCVLVAVVVAVVSAESKDCDPKKVCACSPTPRACPACVPALVCNLARCCFACVYSSIVFFRCLSCACARPCKRAFERASISTGLLAQWFVRACSTHACRRTRTHADARLGARCLLCCRVSLVLQPEARTSVVKDPTLLSTHAVVCDGSRTPAATDSS